MEVRPIDANALFDKISKLKKFFIVEPGTRNYIEYGHHADDILAAVHRAPTLDYAPVRHGEWVKTKKHIWEKDDDGKIDEWAWESGYHNGVRCVICSNRPCIHCEPDYDEKENCHEHYVCSECGRVVLAFEPYCHCGAKMDGGKKNG